MLGIVRTGEIVTITVESDGGAGESDFAFERLEEPDLLAWVNLPADRFVVAVNRIRRDAAR